ncbi:HD domain-containing protein [Streptomyces sp. MS19]|uniref:HD domain-containing protein n=1 Tax=Streptomyces sp. MS19 TaxID=3385972 RepID=UPI0039A1B037
MIVPDADEIRALHERHAPSREAFALVHGHCVLVLAVADDLLARHAAPVDRDLVRAGCLLHDIGVYRLYGPDGTLDHARYVRHGLLGEELLRAEGCPEELCRIASHHTGVGITREEVVGRALPLPPRDFLAETAEERLVMYADKFHTKSDPPSFLTADEYASRVRRFGEGKVAGFASLRAEFGTPDITTLATRHAHPVDVPAPHS